MVKERKDKSPARGERRSNLPVKITSKSPSRVPEKTSSPEKPRKRGDASPSRKSPSRRSPSRKSPARNKSPQAKSPARNSSLSSPTSVPKVSGRKSIGDRKSPGRTPKPLSKSGSSKKISLIETDTDSDTADSPVLKSSKEKPKAAVRGRARKVENYQEPVKDPSEGIAIVEPELDNFSGIIRRSARISQQREVDRIVHVRQEFLTQKLTEFSDDDDLTNLKQLKKSVTPDRLSEARTLDRYSESKVFDRLERYEFGGPFGALFLMIFVPVLVYGVNIMCNKNHCSYTKTPSLGSLKNFSLYFDIKAWSVYFGFALSLFVLSALPLGGKKVSGLLNKEGKLEYRMNGLFSGIVISILTGVLSYYNVPIVQTVTEKYFQMISASLAFGVLLSFYLALKSRYAPISALNPHAVTRSSIYNFWMGKELNPRIFGLVDVKMYLYRFVIIGSFIINGLFLYKNVVPPSVSRTPTNATFISTLKLEPTPILLASLQSIYLLDGLFFESSWITSFEIQYEGVGWMLAVGYAMYPFMSTTLLKYVVEHNVQLSWYELVTATIVFFVGYLLLRGSNSQKDAFRKNPYDPALSHLETIPTSQGKKLLVSGYWGFVRHPNYLGDILMILSHVFFVKLAPPVIFCVMDVLFLITRAKRDGARCKQRYGSSWERYCQRVKYVLVPKIY